MIFLEVLVFLVMFGILVSTFFVKNDKAVLGMLVGLLVVVILQIIVGPYRWQMVPIYVFSIVYIILSSLKVKFLGEKKYIVKRKILRIIGIVFVFILFAITLVFPALIPVKDLPKPNGQYAIGVTDLRLVDNNREELFTEDDSDVRNLSVTVYYPAEDTSEYDVKTYWDKEGQIGSAIAEYQGMFDFMYSHMSLVNTNSHMNAPISTDKSSYPIIMYSHSSFGINTENTILFEELASNGYIVFSINHTYESLGSLFPDGEFIASDASYISKLYHSNDDFVQEKFNEFSSVTTLEAKSLLLQELLVTNELITQMVTIRTNDAIFVLDELELMNNTSTDVFYSKLDLDKIGMMGWSLGGATSEETCIADARVKACANMDGFPYGKLFSATDTFNQPFMYLTSEYSEEFDLMMIDIVYDKLANDAYVISIEEAQHANFMDLPYLLPIFEYLGQWGPIDPQRLDDIRGSLLLGFFDKYLNEEDIDIEAISDQFNETTITAKYID